MSKLIFPPDEPYAIVGIDTAIADMPTKIRKLLDLSDEEMVEIHKSHFGDALTIYSTHRTEEEAEHAYQSLPHADKAEVVTA